MYQVITMSQINRKSRIPHRMMYIWIAAEKIIKQSKPEYVADKNQSCDSIWASTTQYDLLGRKLDWCAR